MKQTTYGVGGFDPTKPDNNIVEEVELPDPEPTPEELARASAIEKLTKLGLTGEEALALVGG
jgi:hypothetical protein